jgi:hypothetical protein
MFRNRTFVGSEVSNWHGSTKIIRESIPFGTIDNPAPSALFLKNTEGVVDDGAYYIQLPSGDSTKHQVWCDMNTLGGGWLLAFCVTNFTGDVTTWLEGDYGTGTNWFTATSGNNLNISVANSLSNKANFRLPAFTSYSFQDMMIRENFNGSIRYKGYRLSSQDTFLNRFARANNTSYVSDVSSIIGASGDSMTNGSSSFSSNTLMFNYSLINDGARIASTPISQESTGGIAARVDNATGYTWRGNLVRDDSARIFSNDGTTTDHTAWIFVR